MKKVQWSSIGFVMIAFVIVFCELFSVHYSYTGIIATEKGQDAVTHAAYQYPYFSDEYVGIALTGYSIRTHSLPLANPLQGDIPATNLLVGFFSVMAELFVLLGLNPLTGYVPFAIGVGMLLCFFAYLFLRNRGVDSFSAVCAVLMLPLIVNGGNLPGMWSLLPFIGGLLLFMVGLVAYEGGNRFIVSIVAFVISLIIYPPMIVFIAPVFLFMFFEAKTATHSKILWTVGISIIAIAAISFIALDLTGAFSFILRNNLVGGIPSFPIWIVLPWFALPFAAVGVYACIKKGMYAFFAPIVVGLVYWITYAFTTQVLIIDYPRVVVITSFLIILLAGFGIGFLVEKAPKGEYARLSLFLKIAVLAVFAIMAVSYPLETWAELVLHEPTAQGQTTIAPASPVTSYLTSDDMRLFSGIEGKWFIAPEWKGLVIGAATHNYPVDSKSATLTVSLYSYEKFMTLNCGDKDAVARRFSLQYAYTEPFSCPAFTLVGSSSEGFYLYKFMGYN